MLNWQVQVQLHVKVHLLDKNWRLKKNRNPFALCCKTWYHKFWEITDFTLSLACLRTVGSCLFIIWYIYLSSASSWWKLNYWWFLVNLTMVRLIFYRVYNWNNPQFIHFRATLATVCLQLIHISAQFNQVNMDICLFHDAEIDRLGQLVFVTWKNNFKPWFNYLLHH